MAWDLAMTLALWAFLSWRGGLMAWQAPVAAGLALALWGALWPGNGRSWRLTRGELGLGLLAAVFLVLGVTGTRPQDGLDEGLLIATLWALGVAWRRRQAWVEPVALTWIALSVAAGLVFFVAGAVQPARWPTDLVGPLLRAHISSRWVSPNQNILAATLSAPGLLLGLALLAQRARGWRRGLALAGAWVGGAAMVYAGSRGAWLSLAVGGAWLFWRWPCGGRKALGWRLALTVLLLGGAVLQAPFSTSRLRHQLQADPQLADSNNGRRIDFWKGAWRLGWEHPLSGWGPGSFVLQAQRLDLPTALDAKHPIARYRLVLEHAHDEWLELAVEAGWPMALAAAGLALTWVLRRLRRGPADGLSLGLEAGVVVALMMSLTDLNLRTPGPLLGLVLVLAVLDPVPQEPWGPRWPRWMGPALGAALLVACLGWWQRQALMTELRAHQAPSEARWTAVEWLAPLDGQVAAKRQDAGRPTRPWDAWAGRAEPAWWWSCSAKAGQAGDVATGLADTRKALDGRPYDAQAWFLLGLRQEAVGQASEAALDVRHALQLEPNYCRALAWASDHAWQQGDRSQARAYYQQVLRAHALVLVEDEMDDLSRAMQVIDPTWVRDRSRRFR